MSEDFDRFFERTSKRMLAYAMMICGDIVAAQNAVQDAYLIASQKWQTVGEYDFPDGWMYKIVRQRALEELRRRRRFFGAGRLPVPSSAASSVEEAVWVREVIRAMRRLPAQQCQILTMYSIEGMTYQEIADELSLQRGAISSTMSKARASLRRRLGMAPGSSMADSLLETGRGDIDTVLRRVDSWLGNWFASDPDRFAHIRDAISAATTEMNAR